MSEADKELLEEMRTTLREAAVVSTPGYALTVSDRKRLELALDRIPRKAYVWLWKCIGEIDRLTAELAETQDHNAVMATEMVDAKSGKAYTELTAALKVAREENARLKRWFADESAHAKEAVKEIDALKGERDKLLCELGCARIDRQRLIEVIEAVRRARSIKDAGEADDAMSDADILIDAALASHTTGEGRGE